MTALSGATLTPTRLQKRTFGLVERVVKATLRKGTIRALALLPGVMNACCGHGNPREAYIQFDNGMIVRGFDKVETP